MFSTSSTTLLSFEPRIRQSRPVTHSNDHMDTRQTTTSTGAGVFPVSVGMRCMDGTSDNGQVRRPGDEEYTALRR